MSKQTKPKDEPRRVGPKFARNVLPESFQIRRPVSPMAELLDQAARGGHRHEDEHTPHAARQTATPVKSTGVESTGVEPSPIYLPSPRAGRDSQQALGIDEFLDAVLPLFPPAKQVILLRLYRWSNAGADEITVSTPRLAAKTNMDEKACRTHLHALISEGYVVRSMDGQQIARFGGSDRNSRGLLLRVCTRELRNLINRGSP